MQNFLAKTPFVLEKINLFHTMCDIVHFRHPNEMGGAGWLFSLVVLNASLPLTVFMYENKVGEDEISAAAWKFCKIALPCTMIAFLTFFLSIKEEYRRTFFSTERGKDLAMRRFQSSNEDSVKADAIFANTRNYWREIEGEVEKWVCENWKRWMEEEPEWLNDNMKARIPPPMIPNIEDRERVELLRNERRRSSLLLGRVSGRRKSSLISADKVAPEAIQ